MVLKKWKLISSENVINNSYIRVDVNDYLLPSGKKAEHYYRMSRPDYVLIIATNQKGEVLVEKRYRWGVEDFVYELPAGWINPKEKLEHAAARECQEETGYVIDKVTKLGILYAQPGFASLSANVMRGTVVDKIDRKPEFDEEEVEISFMTPVKVRKLIKEGIIKDMGFVSAMSFL